LILHAETHVPTQPPATLEDTWVSHADEDQERARGAFTATRQGSKAGFGKAWVSRVVSPAVTSHSERPPAKLGKSSRLLRHADFEHVYRAGRRHFSSNMTVFFLARTEVGGNAGPRVGFTVSRAMGGAVQRNRIRRRMREAARLNLGGLRQPVDVVINPKKSALNANFRALAEELRRAFDAIRTNGGHKKR
jgi:ribonuclease P protein component